MDRFFRIKGNTWCLEGRVSIPVYYLDEKKVILFDSGHSRNRQDIVQAIESRGIRVRAIINSHIHYDHIGNNSYFVETHGSEIIMHETEAMAGSSPYLIKAYYWPGSYCQIEKNYDAYPLTYDRTFSAKDEEIDVEGHVFRLIPLPGHTPGHTGFVTPDHVFYVGDALMDHETIIRSKFPTVMDPEEDMKSKEAIMSVKCSKFVLAHKGVFDDVRELMDENEEDRKRRIKIIEDIFSDGKVRTREELTKELKSAFGMNTQKQVGQMTFVRNMETLMTYLVRKDSIEEYYEDGVLKYRPAHH